jgi:polyphosphate kinase 2 (PPK2 family)
VNAENFIVSKRPHLGSIKNFPRVDFADYERRLASMQSSLQAIQQAYLGTRERAVVVLEGWDTAGKGGIVRRLGWALDPRSFKSDIAPFQFCAMMYGPAALYKTEFQERRT